MKPVIVRNVTIGQGRPKICVPIVARDEASILEEARNILQLPMDLVEWRADWYEHISGMEKTMDMAGKLRQVLGDIPILFTIRTRTEGGEYDLPLADYMAVNKGVASGGFVDLVDVELSAGDAAVEEMIQDAHTYGIQTIVSSHDFEKTPPGKELVHRLERMEKLGSDIAKVAVMPRSREDVLTLLSATLEASAHAEIPLITMSMSAVGTISRLAGEVFGSALTFGAASQASAPGQISVNELRTVLEILHDSRA